MTDKYAEKYGDKKRFSGIIGAFGVISVILALVGLLAPDAFTTVTRTKEIGLRKVNGATRMEVLILFV